MPSRHDDEPPEGPTIVKAAHSTVNWLEDLNGILSEIRMKLNGNRPEIAEVRTCPEGLAGLIARASSDAASLCGLARTINEQLGE